MVFPPWGRTVVSFEGQQGSRKGSQQGILEGGISRRCLEHPVGEHGALGVRPIQRAPGSVTVIVNYIGWNCRL